MGVYEGTSIPDYLQHVANRSDSIPGDIRRFTGKLPRGGWLSKVLKRWNQLDLR